MVKDTIYWRLVFLLRRQIILCSYSMLTLQDWSTYHPGDGNSWAWEPCASLRSPHKSQQNPLSLKKPCWQPSSQVWSRTATRQSLWTAIPTHRGGTFAHCSVMCPEQPACPPPHPCLSDSQQTYGDDLAESQRCMHKIDIQPSSWLATEGGWTPRPWSQVCRHLPAIPCVLFLGWCKQPHPSTWIAPLIPSP